MTNHKLEKKRNRVKGIAKGAFRPVRGEDVKVQITQEEGKQVRVDLPNVLEFMTQQIITLRNEFNAHREEFKAYANKVDDLEAWGSAEDEAPSAEETAGEGEVEEVLSLPEVEEEGS